MKYHFLIGEVAKKYGISNQTLIYYDNKDILTPNFTHDNGYRYYNHMNLERLEIIIALKNSGMTLDKIKKLLNEESRSSLILTMSSQISKIDDEINRLRKAKNYISNKIKYATSSSKREINNEILLLTEPKKQYLRVKSLIGNDDYITPRNQLKEILNERKETTDTIPSRYQVLLNSKDFLNDVFYNIAYYQYEVNTDNYSFPVLKIPKHNYVSIIHFGKYDDLHYTYRKAKKYMKENRLTPIEYIVNLPIVDSWFEPHEDNFITEIKIHYTASILD
ncbi:MerR family transcriptional regulator [Candidatus Izimaplasma bacterium ZiA1]|uniref:MerR family transcriptional regulator n=1 Tax=Candidatus Izimoplasma sp. ZiA1 TaxID=2024899 RepID=UPI00143B5A01